MEEGTAGESIPDLKDIEVKLGRKTPEGLLRWMREEATPLRGENKLSLGPNNQESSSSQKETGRKSLDDKIRKLKMEMAHLRSVDVKILQQLLAVHEGIEAVKWLLEERSTLTSRCSSLTSSQYSLGEGPDTSWRGSWSSLQDPNDKLDNISIGSYLDTLADDMDEYCPSSSESVICSTTLLVSEATVGSRTAGGSQGAKSGIRPSENGTAVGNGTEVRVGSATGGTGKASASFGSPKAKQEVTEQDSSVWTQVSETNKGTPVLKDNAQAEGVKANGIAVKASTPTCSPTRSNLSEKRAASQSPKLKPYTNGKIELDTCKMNGKMHLEYDAHWRWVQSQEDVTFL